MKEELQNYYAGAFSVEPEKVIVDFLHLPDLADSYLDIRIDERETVTRAGHQTVWFRVTAANHTVKRIPVTVDVLVEVEALVTKEKLNRGDEITRQMLEIRPIFLDDQQIQYLQDESEVVGLITRQVIPSGRILRPDMLIDAPDVPRGTIVTVNMYAADLVISTSGKMKKDGRIGEKVQVICETTGKHVSGVLTSKTDVEIEMR